MAIDRWFIGGGAEHSPESARRALYASTGGAEGVGGIDDLKVVPLAVPGGGVRILTGSALIRSGYAYGETQTYMGTVYEQETVSVAATGSGAGRSDMVVLRVEDPYAGGSPWPVPADPATAPYLHIRVISGVPADATRVQDVPGHDTDTAIALARIDIPASTGTIAAGMITDLRRLGQPRRLSTLAYVPVPAVTDLVSATLVPWPASTAVQVEVPEWATHAYVDGEIVNYQTRNNPVAGTLRARLDTAGSGGVEAMSSPLYYNEQYAGDTRLSRPVGGKITIPPELRGQVRNLRMVGLRNGGTGFLRASTDALVRWNVTWAEEI